MKRVKTKKFNAALADILNMADVVFAGVPDDPGWVTMEANLKGRECVDALFPHAHIAWREPEPGMPPDWRGFSIHLPDVVASTETKLPLEITGGKNLYEVAPDALAFLLAIGVNRQGGRSAIWRGEKMEIYVPPAGNN